LVGHREIFRLGMRQKCVIMSQWATQPRPCGQGEPALLASPRLLHLMTPFLAELLGTMLLVILGDGVVANVVLSKTKGQNAGWIVITAGWAFGVAVAVYAVGSFSGAHLNPAVTIGLASIGKFAWASVPGYIAAQMLGAFLGATIVWLAYLPHWPVTESQPGKLAVFCTAPA